MCAGSPPPAPDYKGAAESTAASQRVDQYTPFGSLVYSPTPGSGGGALAAAGGAPTGGGEAGWFGKSVSGTGGFPTVASSDPNARWQSTITLNPEAQKTLDAQMRTSSAMAGLTEGQLGRVSDQYSQPMDLSSVQDIANKSYEAQTSRLDPQWNQREEQTRNRLANQGLMSGGEAYGSEMRDFNTARNDAYQQANLASIATMPQTYQLASSAYNQPLNTLNALRTGAQIQNPQFGGAGQPTNYLQAAQAGGDYAKGLYNSDVSQANAQQQSAATMALMYALLA